MDEYILEMRGITKQFSGVKALDDVSFRVRPHRIHALVGENGAGKSTLMNVLSGLYPHGEYEGEIIVDGAACRFKDINDSEKKGIAIIHQELALVPELSVAENIFIGNEQHRRGVIDWDESRKKAAAMIKKVGLDVSVEARIRDLGLGKQQLVEIAKALSKNVRVLILDEPTAALNDEDSAHLLNLLIELKAGGITCILISHKLNEIVRVAQEVTVLRDGKAIQTLDIADATENAIIRLMVGRDLTDRFPKRVRKAGAISFEVRNWNVFDPRDSGRQIISDVSFYARRGEVVGISGLMGAGRTELALSIFGRYYGTKISGKIFVNGREATLRSVSDAIRNGLAYVTEDRKQSGLALISSIRDNISIAALEKISRNNVIDNNEDNRVAEEYREKLDIRSSGILQRVGSLSGGNQQKVMLSKWIFTDPDTLILDEPTRGVDVGAKYEIYTIINSLSERDKTVIMISSELPELLGMCDRIYVLNRGMIVGEVTAEEASQERIMELIMKSNK